MSKGPKKRSREAPNVNIDLIAIYEDLASENSEIRLNAGLRLLSAKYSDADLARILERLFRGLCSGRKAARLGFSVALTEFLTSYVTSAGRFTVKHVLSVLKEQTEPAPGASGQELRDYYFGRLFAAEALIKSKVFLEPKQAESWTALIKLVLELYHKKQWLREECGWVLQQALLSLRDQSAFLPQARTIFEQLDNHKLTKTLEGIALWITFCLDGFTGNPLAHTVFQNGSPLSDVEITHTLGTLKAQYVNEDGYDKSHHSIGATWSDKLHFAWHVIFEAALKEHGSRHSFKVLWKDFVDEYLFANAASEQKKYWGFLMVQNFVKSTKEPSQLMGANFQRCFYNQLSKAERHLHGIATKTMRAILNAAQADAEEEGPFARNVLVHMVGYNGWVDFDKITKTKFVEKLLTMTTPYDWDECLKRLDDRMWDRACTPHHRDMAQFHIACADFILNVVKNYSPSQFRDDEAHKSRPALRNAVETLAYVACGLIPPEKVHAFDERIRSAFRGRLLSALSHLITQTDDPSTYPALAADHLLATADFRSNLELSTSIERAGERMAKCAKHASLLGAIHSSHQENFRAYRAFRLLFALGIIQALSGDADALNVLEELETAYDTHLDENDNLREGSSTFVEILLSLISKPSVLFRRVGKEVLSSCTAMIDQEGLDSMFNVLLKSENLAGQQELFDAEDDEEMQEHDLDGEGISDSGGSDSDVLSINGDADDDELIEFENKLAQALGTHRAEEELESGDVQESDEEMMDDEQMVALDPLMANMFKERKKASHKKENKDAKETIVQFKTRVLELLEIYVQQESQNLQNSILATIPAQCIACMQITKSKQVSEKAAAVVKAALNAYKLNVTPEPQKKVLKVAKQELRIIHENVIKPGSNLYLRTCSQASLFLGKMMLNNGATVDKVWKEYSRTGKNMAVAPDVKVAGTLFQDWFNWLTQAKSTLKKREASA